MNTAKSSVTLIGLGPMGQAMVHTLLAAGYPVTVWNRTASRAEPLVAAGARLASSPTEAVAASDLVILSLTDYQAMYDILSTAESALGGRTIVNLSSDSPGVTREAAAWADGHGAHFIAGGVMTPAHTVGTESAYVFYSGPESVFEANAPSSARPRRPEWTWRCPRRSSRCTTGRSPPVTARTAGPPCTRS